MEDLYQVLQVGRSASPAVIAAAYQALRAEAVARGDADAIASLDRAYTVLGNAEARARYDEPQTAAASSQTSASAEDTDSDDVAAVATEPKPGDAGWVAQASVEGEPTRDPAASFAAYQDEQARLSASPPPKQTNKGLVLGLAGMVLLLIGVLGAGLWYLLYGNQDDDGDFTVAFDDNASDIVQFLAAMALRPDDVPEGIDLFGEATFNNEEWAAIVDEVDPAAKQRQLDAQGRVRNFLSLYQSPALDAGSTAALGRPFSFTSQSSIFKDEQSARDSIASTCDVELEAGDLPNTLEVPKLADQSTGFEVRTVVDDFGNEIVDTTVCFRTGRIVHSVSQRGLEGTENLDLSVELARKMLERVKAAFDGERREPQAVGGG